MQRVFKVKNISLLNLMFFPSYEARFLTDIVQNDIDIMEYEYATTVKVVI